MRVDAAREVLDRLEVARLALRDETLDAAQADVLDLREAVADRLGAVRAYLDGEVHAAAVHVRLEDGDAEAVAFRDRLRDAVGVAVRGLQHGRHVLGRVVRLQVGGLVGDRAVADGVRLVERVPGERLDEVEELVPEVLVVALLAHAGEEALALLDHDRGDLLTHRLPHHVGLAQRVAGERARDVEHLLLVGDDAVGLFEDRAELLVRVERLSAPVLHIDVLRDLLERAGPEEGDHGGELADVLRLQLHDVPAHARRLHLEHAERVAVPEDVRRGGIAVRDIEQVQPLTATFLDQVERLLEDREVRQAEVVDLQQADLLDVAHRVLRRRNRGLLVRVLARRALQRHDVRQRFRGDDDAGGVRRRVPRDALEGLRRVDEFADGGLCLVRGLQLGRLLERVGEGDVQGVRHHPRDAVRGAEVHAQRATGVAKGGLRPQRPEGADLRDAVAAVLLDGVLDDLAAALVREVEVDVRHRDALGVEEPLEHQPVRERFDVRHVERVQDDRGRGRAPDAHADARRLRELRDVLDDQHVLVEPGLSDDVQLVVEPVAVHVGHVRVAAVEAFLALLAEPLARGLAVRDPGVRELGAPELNVDVHPLRDRRRIVRRLGVVREQRPHLLLRTEVERVAVELEAVLVVDRAVRADAEQHLVRADVVRAGVVRVVGDDGREAHLAGDVEHARHQRRELRDPVLHHLEVVAVLEDIAEPARDVHRLLLVILAEGGHELAGRAA